jgi:hypothetical protein
VAPISNGLALIREGKVAEGISRLKEGIAVWDASGGKVGVPTMNAFLTEAMELSGDLDDALRLIDESTAQVERPGWEERLHYAEILRLKGWTLSLKGDVERNFLASLDWFAIVQAAWCALRIKTHLASCRISGGTSV